MSSHIRYGLEIKLASAICNTICTLHTVQSEFQNLQFFPIHNSDVPRNAYLLPEIKQVKQKIVKTTSQHSGY